MLENHFMHPSDYAESKKIEAEKDTLMIYCPSCGGRVDVKITHPTQGGNYHQAINLLPEIATTMKWDKMDVVCRKCTLLLNIDPVLQDRQRVELKIRIDCEGMSPGMESWYEDQGFKKPIDWGTMYE